ncbi:MAG: hypothetical protein K0R39_4273 [Symbiobacteriaceae bacterium]|jgi:hypothetical protein|nr:hypothetical protein [Symbiobacteriaceae bacterium]
MEHHDQVTMDRAHRAWATFSEVEQGALLVELSASLRRRLATLDVEHEVAAAYRAFAASARTAGNALIFKHGIPFVPDPPFRWSKMRIEELNARVPEIREWASAAVLAQEQTLPVRHTALDLSQAGHELERQLQRERDR